MLLQFLAEPAEIAEWVQSWKDQKGLAMAVLTDRFAGSYAQVATVPAGVLAGGDAVVVLSTAPLRVDVPADRFVESNRDLFVVDVGRRTPDTLRESAIRTTASAPAADKVWRWAINRARRSMRRGATVVTAMGTEGRVPGLYYSEGAAAAARRGVRMRVWAGGNEYRLP
ncbi:hypothetical protein [Actinoplanes sp. N902-109]|uniref:hypothetical protein n=1 Tax=Actinoplanes sp. (strain N902-109) TaxID=649831 RepID=UPI00032956AB|nr:hypothetical protein [Actinoplanes sp. N902-109]AGL19302.1 hypothetical protein L083_5792 [Actinoplanes sp. N902-109]